MIVVVGWANAKAPSIWLLSITVSWVVKEESGLSEEDVAGLSEEDVAGLSEEDVGGARLLDCDAGGGEPEEDPAGTGCSGLFSSKSKISSSMLSSFKMDRFPYWNSGLRCKRRLSGVRGLSIVAVG